MKTIAVAVCAALLLPSGPAFAQQGKVTGGSSVGAQGQSGKAGAKSSQSGQTMCQSMVQETAGLIPDLNKNPNAHQKLGLTKEHLQAALVTLDAARLAGQADLGGCITMVHAARTMLARGESLPEDDEVVELSLWDYEPLYVETWRASALIDQPAYNKEGKVVGEVHDILMTPDGKITGLIVEGGGVLDIGDTHARVKWADVELLDDVRGGVIVPLEKERMTDFSLFDDDDRERPKVRQSEVRMSNVLGEPIRFVTGEPYGYVDDLLISKGKVKATVIRPDIAYGTGAPYATPYYAYEYGYSPGYDFYVLPYGRDQLAGLSGFDAECVQGPNAASEPDKKR